jgi:DNA-binding GntR family transcriptional regulator
VFPRRGVRVAVMDHARHFETLEMRAALEGLALRHAASCFPPGHLGALTDADRACSNAADVETWEAANQEFHRLLIAPCPMPQLMQTVARLQVAARWGGRMLGGARPLALPREDRDHRAILRALQDNETDHAAALLTRHILRGHLLINR